MKASNMYSPSGNRVPNQIIIETENEIVFQSYGTTIVSQKDGKTFLDKKYWDYSTTIGKYRNQFLGETKKETQKKIDSGEYILTDLN